MKVTVIGAGPAGLYFSILLKKVDPSHEIDVYERNRSDDTFGFGVVFSDQTMENLEAADPESYRAITDSFYHWDDIDIHFGGEVLTSTGHGFAGLSRIRLLEILGDRAAELGVRLHYETVVDDLSGFADSDLIVAADGLNSTVREIHAEHFEPDVDARPNLFVWMGTTLPFPAFTFYFKENEHGMWRGHCYQYEEQGASTFIVETTEEVFRKAGLDVFDEAATLAYCENLFKGELDGHRLIGNRSIWRRFPTVRNARWRHGRVVLLGDAVHTAHFSIGSGTKLAMEDAIALVDALTVERDLPAAVDAYEAERRPVVQSLQRAAQASLEWFEGTERYMDQDPVQFGFNLLTRSLRITHEDLRLRDSAYVDSIDRWVAEQASVQTGVDLLAEANGQVPPPLFTPFKLRDLVLPNRVVLSAMCQYSSVDGMPNDWHLVHLGSRAVGGAGLLMTEMTDVTRDGRITHGCAGMYKPEHVPAWKRIVDFVHQHSPSKIGIQLAHAGRKGSTRLAWEGIDEPLPEATGWPVVAASPIPWFPHSPVPRALTREDMDETCQAFARATQMSEEAGFDLVELHCAHGYLLSSFISPLTNTRTDAYGGSLENRMRFPLEVLDAIRSVWPEHKPIAVRISAVDWAPGGMEPADAVAVAQMLREHGCDLTDVSAGQTVPYAKPIYGRQFQTPFSDRIRTEAGIATMAVGNISSFMDVNTIIAAGRADLCAMARMHLWNPYWTRHAAFELGHPTKWPPPYESMNRYSPRFK